MTKGTPEIDWNNPEAVEAMLEAEGLGNIDDDYSVSQKVINILDISENIEHREEKGDVFFYYEGNMIGVIKYMKGSKYIQFIGNINGINEEDISNSSELLLQDYLKSNKNSRILGLGTYMLTIFFSQYCEKGDEIKMRIENPKVHTILEKLRNQGDITEYYDIEESYRSKITSVKV